MRRAKRARAASRAAADADTRTGGRGGARQARGLDGALAREAQPLADVRSECFGIRGDAGDDASREAGLGGFAVGGVGGECVAVHGAIPFALRAFAKACTAREQCVLTLPSEQPIEAAVSATSSSSQ